MFRPIEVRLHNFCGYDDAVFPLAGGLTAVTGRNGSGKTTVLRGLMYALTGVVDGSWGTQSDLQKDGTIDPGYAEATLVGDNRELVIRRFYTSGVKFPDRITERLEDGTFKEVAIRRAQVDAYMQNIFGIPCRFMFQLCWCRQAQLDVMLTSPAAIINTFLGVVFNMQNVEKLRDKLHAHESRITQLSTSCLSELPRLQEALKALPDIQELERLKEAAQEGLKNAEIRYNAMMQLMLNGITKLEWEEKHRELSNAIQEEQKEISSFGDMTEPPTNGESVADLGNLTNATLSERTHWSVRVSTTNTALLSLKKELTAAENEHVRQTELFSDWTGKLDAVSDTCDFCGGHVTDKETYLRIKCKMITGYDSKEEMHRAVEQEQEQHREDIKKITDQIDESLKQLEYAQEKLRLNEEALEDINKGLELAWAHENWLKNSQALDAHRVRLAALQDRLADLEKQRPIDDETESERKRAAEELEGARTKYENLKEAIISARKDAEYLTEMCTATEKTVEQYNINNEARKVLADFRSILSQSRAQTRYLSAKIKQLNAFIAHFMEQTDLPFTLSLNESTHVFEYTTSDGFVHPAAHLSGAQKNISAVILQMALVETVRPTMNLFLFDEPAESLDASNKVLMADLFQKMSNLLTTLDGVMLIVTRDEQLIDSCATVLNTDQVRES